MATFLIGCLHLGHESMARHRGFSDSWEHDEHLIRCWNSVVTKRDKVFILGDITMETSKHYHKLDELNGLKSVVLGNHDRVQDIPKLLEYVMHVAGVIDYNDCILTHVPIHPSEIGFYNYNFHSHIHHLNKLHEIIVPDKYQDSDSVVRNTLHKYINVDAHLINYKPVNFEDIINGKYKEKKERT